MVQLRKRWTFFSLTSRWLIYLYSFLNLFFNFHGIKCTLPSLVKWSEPVPHFLKLLNLFSYCWGLCVLYIIRIFFPLSDNVICKYFLPVHGLSFQSVDSSFRRAEISSLKSNLSFFSFKDCAVGVASCLTQVHKSFLPCFLLEVV